LHLKPMVVGVILALGLAVAAQARADLAPPGLCTGQAAGDECDEAVDGQGHVVGRGVCVAETCRRATPDGSVTYDCVMCRPSGEGPMGGAGSGGQAGAPDVSGGTAGATPQGGTASSAGAPAANGGKAGQPAGGHAGAAPSTKTEKSDSGCSLRRSPAGTGAGGMILLGLVAGALRRRSRL
jgi:hypothetical protein